MWQLATIQWILVINVVIEIIWFSVVHVFAGGQVNHQPPPHAHHLLSVCDVCDHHLLCPYQRPSCHSQKQVRVLLRGNTVVSSGKLMSMNILCSSYQYYHCEIIKLKILILVVVNLSEKNHIQSQSVWYFHNFMIRLAMWNVLFDM